MPDVPTLAEAGVPGYEATIWLGLMAPKNTPASIVARLNAEVSRIVGHPDTAKTWKAQGATPMTMSTAEFTRYLDEDIVKWAQNRQGLRREGRAMTPAASEATWRAS